MASGRSSGSGSSRRRPLFATTRSAVWLSWARATAPRGPGKPANEDGLKALGDRIDGGRPRARRAGRGRLGAAQHRRRPRWSRKRRGAHHPRDRGRPPGLRDRVGLRLPPLRVEQGAEDRLHLVRRGHELHRPVQRAHRRLGHPGRQHRPGGQVVRHGVARSAVSGATPSRSCTWTPRPAPPSCSRSRGTPGSRCPALPESSGLTGAAEDQHRLQRLGRCRSWLDTIQNTFGIPINHFDRHRLPRTDRRRRLGRRHQHGCPLPGPGLQ